VHEFFHESIGERRSRAESTLYVFVATLEIIVDALREARISHSPGDRAQIKILLRLIDM